MEWLAKGWDRTSWVAAGLGVTAGVVLVLWGHVALGVLAGPLVAASALYAQWQIPPPGRSKAPGTPADGWSRTGRVVVAVLLVVLAVDVVARAVT